MPARLSPPIAAYFASLNARDVTAMAAAFAEDAVVLDEGKTHRGREAIHRWMEEAIAKYGFTVEVKEVDALEDKSVVTATLTGRFPGSPLSLRHEFTLGGGRIERLEIG